MDFSKAFDVVPHERLLLKLNYYGIRELNPWFRDFLSGRKQQVVVEGKKSREVLVESGVPQGTVIGPLCFLLFINDLPLEVTGGSFTGIFADDTLLAKIITCTGDSQKLQSDLTGLEKWTELWGMKFNADKCEVMTVTNKRSPIKTDYILDGTCLKKKEQLKYLGVTIDNKLTFKFHIEEKAKKAATVLNMIRRNLYFAPESVKSKAYMATVRPLLEYASVCWSPNSQNLKTTLEVVQNNAAKFVTNNYPKKGEYEKFSVTKIVQDLGWETLEQRRINTRITMVYKIINSEVILPPDLLPKKIFKRPPRTCNSVTVSQEHELQTRVARTKTCENIFIYSAPTLWNNIVTPQQASSPSVDAFKSHFCNPNDPGCAQSCSIVI